MRTLILLLKFIGFSLMVWLILLAGQGIENVKGVATTTGVVYAGILAICATVALTLAWSLED